MKLNSGVRGYVDEIESLAEPLGAANSCRSELTERHEASAPMSRQKRPPVHGIFTSPLRIA